MKTLRSFFRGFRIQAWPRYVGFSFALYDRYSGNQRPKLCGFHLYLGFFAVFFSTL